MMFKTLLFLSFMFQTICAQENENTLNEAFQAYQEGVKAEIVTDREAHFNRSLSLYLTLLHTCCPEYGSGKIYYNIANCYFQLNVYPLALLNYYRSEKLRPRDETVKYNKEIVLEKLGIKEKKEQSLYDQIFFFQNYFSLPERLQIFTFLICLMILPASFYIWKKVAFLKKVIAFAAVFSAIFFLSLMYTRYISPMEAIMTESSMLYRDAGFQYSKISNRAQIAGSKVKVLEILDQGEWLKVITEQGEVGYLPYKTIQLI